MNPRIVPTLALALSLAALPAAAQQDAETPGPPHETALTVGEAPPVGFSLPSLDGEVRSLDDVDRPLLLVFFRGTW